jgi:hypothetical protein
LVVLDRNSTINASSRSQRFMKWSTIRAPISSRSTPAISGKSRSKSAAAAKSWSLLPKYRITIDGSMFASAAIARMVARSKPDSANRSLAAARITALVSAEDLRMPTSVCQQLLTLAPIQSHSCANKCWQTKEMHDEQHT